jgi:tetratricopeptide (TPR) repeat protein
MIAPYKPEIQDTLGYVLLKSGQAEKAKQLFQKALKLMPKNPSILYHLGTAYYKTGENNRAIEALKLALKTKNFPEYSKAEKLLERLQKG